MFPHVLSTVLKLLKNMALLKVVYWLCGEYSDVIPFLKEDMIRCLSLFRHDQEDK